MKKHLLLGLTVFASLIGAPDIIAAPIVEDLILHVNKEDGNTYRNNNSALAWAQFWQNTTYADVATVKFTAKTLVTSPFPLHCPNSPADDVIVRMVPVQENKGYDYVLSIADGSHYYISSYSFTAVPGNLNVDATINGEVLGEAGYTFTGSNLDENTKQYTFTLVAPSKGAAQDQLIELRDFVVTLSPILDHNAAGMSYYARELDGKNIKLYVNESNRYLFLNDNLDGLGHGNNTAEQANVWHAEYVQKTASDGTDLSGLRLSSKGVYLGKMPNATREFVNITTKPEEAGLWRFFAEGAGYGLSCSEYQDGNIVTLTGFGAATEANKNAWIQIGADGVQRWGVWPAAAHWNVIVVPEVEYTLNCDGVLVTTTGVPGEIIAAESLTDLPEYFVPTAGNLTIPEAGGTLTVPGEWRFPFSFDTPYYLNLKQNTDSYHNVYYDGTNSVNKDVNASYLTLNPRLIWFMKDGGIENNTKVVTLHNLAADENHGITIAPTESGSYNGVNCTIGENPTKFAVSANGTGFTLRIVSTTNACINEFSNNGKMAIWQADAAKTGDGSRLWTIALGDSDFDVESWIADDGYTYAFDATKLETAKNTKSLEALRDLFVYVPKTKMTREDVISGIALDDKYVTLHRILSHTSLYDNETASAVIYDRLTIPEESEDFEAVLEECKAVLKTIKAAAIVTEYLNGKKVLFSCSRYIKKGFSNGDSSLTIDAAWEFFADDNNTSFTIRNAVDGLYAKGLSVTDTKDDATHYILANDTVLSNGTFAIQDPGQSGDNNYLNNNNAANPTHLRYFSAGPGNGASFWNIYLVTPEMEQTWINNAIAALTVSDDKIGNEPGLFKEAEGRTDKLAELQELTVEAINYPEIYKIIAGESDYNVKLFDLNSLAGPALIQFAYTPSSNTFDELWSGKNCISDQNHSAGLAGTLFKDVATYVFANGRLHSLRNGMGIINGTTGPKVYEGEDWNINAESMQVEFTNVGRTTLITTPDNIQRHCYAIKEVGSNNTFGGTSTDGGTITWNSVEGIPADNFAYTVWYVKNLTVNVEEGGYKLWRTPVAVNFDGNTDSGAYVVSVNGTRITTDPVEGSDTYGAGTIFILTQTVNLTVENGVAVDAPTAGRGHHAKQMHTLKAGNVYLSIHTDAVASEASEAEQNGYTMYFDAPAGNTVKMDVIIPEEDTERILEAHEALIEATNSTEDPLQHGTTMDLALGGSSDTTQIAEVNAEGNAANSVYDLQGRKLVAPIKGINIINGKKILVK